MASSKEFTYQDVAGHNTAKSLYVVIHDGAYDCTNFASEHPGGDDVLQDVAGRDATEAFEDIGHSDEAREILKTLLVGKLKGESSYNSGHSSGSTTKPSSSSSSAMYLLFLVGGLAAVGYYAYLHDMANSKNF